MLEPDNFALPSIQSVTCFLNIPEPNEHYKNLQNIQEHFDTRFPDASLTLRRPIGVIPSFDTHSMKPIRKPSPWRRDGTLPYHVTIILHILEYP